MPCFPLKKVANAVLMNDEINRKEYRKELVRLTIDKFTVTTIQPRILIRKSSLKFQTSNNILCYTINTTSHTYTSNRTLYTHFSKTHFFTAN